MSEILDRMREISSRDTRLNKLVEECSEKLKTTPNSIDLLLQLTEANNLLGFHRKAIDLCRQIINLNPNHKEALNNLFFAYDRLEEFEQAILIFREYLDLYPLIKLKKSQHFENTLMCRNLFKGNKPEPILELWLPSNYPSQILDINFSNSFQVSKIGWSSKGDELFRIVLEKYPQDITLWNAFSFSNYSLENYDEALKNLNYALKIDKENPQTHLMLGKCYLKVKEYKKAEEELFYVIQHQKINPADILGHITKSFDDPDDIDTRTLRFNIDAWSELGELYITTGEYQKAITACDRTTFLYMKFVPFSIVSLKAPTYKNLGIAYYMLDNNKRALKAFKKALRYDPKCIEVLEKMGEVYLEMNKLKQAIDMFQHVVGLKPNDPLGWHMLSKSYFEDGKVSQAIETNERCLTLNPNFTPAIELKKQLTWL